MKKWNSVFANLAISYISIVLVLVLLLCSVFYMYFSRNYKEELRTRNQLILENAAQTIETSVLRRAQQIYLDIALNKTVNVRLFADSSYRSNHSKTIDLQELLKSEVVSNSDIVQAVHLYYPGQNVLLSSAYGLRLNADREKSKSYLADWIEGMRNNKESSLWTPARMVPQDIYSNAEGGGSQALITYAHGYPFQSSGENSDVIVAIDVKESAVSGVIRNMMPSQYAGAFILNRFGNTVSDADKEKLGRPSDVSAEEIQAAKGSGTIDQASRVVSYQTIPSTGWRLYSVVSSGAFYEKSIFIQKLILGICLLAILIGLIMSGILARANYGPIKRLTAKIKGLLGSASENVANEYRLIDTAFAQLNAKVASLEETLEANSSAIRHNVVLNLIRNGYAREELAEEFPFLGLSREYGRYCCLILDPGSAFAGMNSRNLQYAVYQMIGRLETASLPDSRILAEALPDKKVVVILCADQASDELLQRVSQFVVAEGRERFKLDFQVSWGSWVQEMIGLHKSYDEARILMKYAYLLPETPILNDRGLLDRENSTDEIPQVLLTKIKDKLHARQSEELAAAVEQLVTVMREGRYSADYCRFILANTVFVFSDYLKSVRYKHPDQEHRDLFGQYSELPHILAFQEWLSSSAALFISHMEKRNSERAVSSLESVKRYVHDHLSEDLSLEAVAAQVYLSPKYLSKLFKEEIGVTYTDYVTSQRMERAKALIETNKMTIEQIASTVGYGTAAYFIKKFKEMHGCTPGNYLRAMAKQV
ncbi:AraC family transcriptional regulator [Cohnella thailandensis]|uniref:AraC family transcriptional regulator n=1 Tax=Cohnella thailandensis TaxID=557557 RepID=A0A841SQQ8_9BACL|nr:AraC family transcriptional regulator [Cohnella thailandensis]MBB6634284.1 AraC family transcriptional regulator [Cohnella thailandensis]MBP1972218.1 AraC-like DNA-binding protein [Cohnella thailandensis]